ncbi:glycosyltransferase [bacterium]|nr:glycosyltransferase [bacterium]
MYLPAKPEIVYIRPSLSTGGVLFSDIEFLKVLGDLGYRIKIITGRVFDQSALKFILEQRYELIEDQHFDKLYLDKTKDEQRHIKISECLRKLIDNPQAILFFSNQFVGSHIQFSRASCILAEEYKAIFRNYDPADIDLTMLLEFSQKKIRFSPISKLLALQLEKYVQDKSKISVAPFFMDSERYKYARQNREILRKLYGYTSDSILVFQPTRVAPVKRCDKALILAHGLQKHYGNSKTISLVISGGSENLQGGFDETRKIQNIAKELGVANFFLKRGLGYFVETAIYYAMADVVTYMSDIEGFGTIPAEAANSGVPLVTTYYKNILGDNVFEEAYPEYDAIITETGNTDLVLTDVVKKVVDELENSTIDFEKNRKVSNGACFDVSNHISEIKNFIKILL